MARLVHMEGRAKTEMVEGWTVKSYGLNSGQGALGWAGGRTSSSASGWIGYPQRRGERAGESKKGRRKLESSMKGMQGRMKQSEQWGAQRRPGTCRMTCLWLKKRPSQRSEAACRASFCSSSERCEDCKGGERGNTHICQQCITRRKSLWQSEGEFQQPDRRLNEWGRCSPLSGWCWDPNVQLSLQRTHWGTNAAPVRHGGEEGECVESQSFSAEKNKKNLAQNFSTVVEL